MLRKTDGQSIFQAPTIDPNFLDAFMDAIVDPESGKVLEYRLHISDREARESRLKYAVNKFGCLIQGIKRGIVGIVMMRNIHRLQVPAGQKVAYIYFV